MTANSKYSTTGAFCRTGATHRTLHVLAAGRLRWPCGRRRWFRNGKRTSAIEKAQHAIKKTQCARRQEPCAISRKPGAMKTTPRSKRAAIKNTILAAAPRNKTNTMAIEKKHSAAETKPEP